MIFLKITPDSRLKNDNVEQFAQALCLYTSPLERWKGKKIEKLPFVSFETVIELENSPFKLKKPYLELIEETMKAVQKELAKVKSYLKKNSLKVEEIKRDDAFTMYLFIYQGYEEHHNYFNPRIRNKVQELMVHYLFKRFKQAEATIEKN